MDELHGQRSNVVDHLVPFLRGNNVRDMKPTDLDITTKVNGYLVSLKNVVKFKPRIAYEEVPPAFSSEMTAVDNTSPENNDPQTIEFILPLHHKSIMNQFKATLFPNENDNEFNTIIIDGKIEEKILAEEQYEDAIKQNKSAILGRLDAAASDMFIMNLGAIPANYFVTVEYSYLLESAIMDIKKSENSSDVLLTIPLVASKRFVDNGDQEPVHQKNNRSADIDGINLSMTIECSPPAMHITGKMENNDIRIIVHNRETGKWELDANQLRENVEDIKLNINLNKGRKAVIGHIADQFEFIEAGKIGTFMTNIYPNIEMLDDTGNFDTPNMEYAFVIDRSGSMSGSRIEHAKSALLAMIDQLPADCSFLICSFGNHFDFWERTFQPYNEDNKASARRYIDNMSANMGGTEIYRPLKEITDIMTENIRHIMVFTDGEVSNTSQILELCARNSQNTYFHGIGIGNSCSTALVDGIAERSDGYSIYVANRDRMEQKVCQLARNTIEPRVTLKKIQFLDLSSGAVTGPAVSDNDDVRIKKETCLFYDMKLSRKFFLDIEKNYRERNIVTYFKVMYTFQVGDTEFEDLRSIKINPPGNDYTLRSQYANQEIRKLEKERYNSYDNNTAEIISKIIALSKSGRVLCSHTAFVGVSNRMSVGEPTVHQSILDIHYTESNCPPPRIPSVGRGNRRMRGGSLSTGIQCDSITGIPQMPLTGSCRTSSRNRENMSGFPPTGSFKPKMTEEPYQKPPSCASDKKIHLQLMALANFQGFWEYNDELLKIAQKWDSIITRKCVDKLRPADMSDILLVSSLTLVLLSIFAADFGDEWSMMKRKVLKFLKQQKDFDVEILKSLEINFMIALKQPNPHNRIFR